MTTSICIKVDNLKKYGYPNLKEWFNIPKNEYVGRRGRIWITHPDKTKEMFFYKQSKWHNPFKTSEYTIKKSLQLYVLHLFQKNLIYELGELEGKTLGCFCSEHKHGDNPLCHAQVLADLIERCYKPIEDLIKKKQQLEKPTGTITITFGEQAEGHHGMIIHGEGRSDKGFTTDDLRNTKKKFEDMGIQTELVILNQFLPDDIESEEASILIARNAVSAILEESGETDKTMYKEQIDLKWDKLAFMRGKVKNKRARYNLVYGNKNIKPDYENKQGRVVSFKDIPITERVRDSLPYYFGDVAKNLAAEGNYYYVLKLCGIGFHGDAERKMVIAVRLGLSIPLHYQWYYKHSPVGERAKFMINSGDLYAMSEKATGYDWKRSIIPTLRHAAGCKKYLTIKKKKNSISKNVVITEKRMNKIILVPSIYSRRNTKGDFSWMAKQPEYGDAIFVFNDNEKAFNSHSCEFGKGNASVRPFQCKTPPRATGICTGRRFGPYRGGYTELNDNAKYYIDRGISKLQKLLETGNYNRVFYSSTKSGGLGTGIFCVNDDVKIYIVAELKRITK
jgi:hypothetical protein